MPIQQPDGTLTDGPVAPTDQSTDPLGELVFETRVLHESLRLWLNNDAPSRMLSGDGREVVLDPVGNLPVSMLPTPVVVTVTPVVDTNVLASGDLAVAALVNLPNVSVAPGKTTVLYSIGVVDAGVQSASLEFWFFDSPLITMPTLNAAWAISDADATHVVGAELCGSPYKASSNNSVAFRYGIGAVMRTAGVSTFQQFPGGTPVIQTAPAGASRDLWVAVISRGTPTYPAATNLQLTFTFYPDA